MPVATDPKVDAFESPLPKGEESLCFTDLASAAKLDKEVVSKLSNPGCPNPVEPNAPGDGETDGDWKDENDVFPASIDPNADAVEVKAEVDEANPIDPKPAKNVLNIKSSK